MNLPSISSTPLVNPSLPALPGSVLTASLSATPPGFQDNDASAFQSVGKDFESIFLSMMLKEMRNTIDSSGEGGLFPGEKTDTLGGLFDQFLGQHLASANTLGISQAVMTYLSNQAQSIDSD